MAKCPYQFWLKVFDDFCRRRESGDADREFRLRQKISAQAENFGAVRFIHFFGLSSMPDGTVFKEEVAAAQR